MTNEQEQSVLNIETNQRYVRKYLGLISIIVCLILTTVFFGFNLATSNTLNRQLEIQAKSFFDEIVNVRSWAASHGGVYVPLESSGGINIYLDKIEGIRSLITCDGKQYTLKNPAVITRELSESHRHQELVRYKITSLKPLNPDNAPDEFEKLSLRLFEKGETENKTFEDMYGKTFYRYMSPLKVEESCLKCHASQGYKVDDIRGGIVVSILADDVKGQINRARIWTGGAAIGVLLMIIASIQFISRHFIQDLHRAQQALRTMATTDGLTGLSNRIAGMNMLRAEVSRSRRNNEDLSIALLDLDRFKTINDSYGHSAGDDVLRELASRIEARIRDYDVACRYGGEEFLLIMPGIDTKQAVSVVERILAAAQSRPVSSGHFNINMAFSAGVTTLAAEDNVEMLINRADTLLYKAKAEGRARVKS